MDQLQNHLAELDELATWVLRLAQAAQDLDRTFAIGPPAPDGPARGIALVDEHEWIELAASWRARWSLTDDIREFIHPVAQSEWNRLVFGQSTAFCHLGGSYVGGGVIIGPDGRRYPMVVPEVSADGRVYRANGFGIDESNPNDDVLTLGGSDLGWDSLDSRLGVTAVRDDMHPVLKAVVFLGMATNSSISPVPAPSIEELGDLRVDAGGRAWFDSSFAAQSLPELPDAPEEVELAPDLRLIPDREGNLQRVDRDNSPNRYYDEAVSGSRQSSLSSSSSGGLRRSVPTRAQGNAVSGALDLAVGGLTATVRMQDLSDGNNRAYQVVFQENEDGRRRALVRLFGLGFDETGKVRIQPSMVAMEEDGRLDFFDLTYKPTSRPVLSGDPSFGAVAVGKEEDG